MENRKSLKNTILTLFGLLAVVLGLIGIFLPVLPTTPFLLLASALFVRSSQRMHSWLMHNRILGPYLHTYLECGAVTRRTRAHALVFLWTSLSLSMLWINKPIVHIILPIVGMAVTVHLMKLKTIDDKKATGHLSAKNPERADRCPDTGEVMESGV